MYFKKSRGQQRKYKMFLRWLETFEPFKQTDKEEEHFHVPCGTWLGLPKTSGKIKTAVCRKWIEKTEEFIANKPKDLPFCKVVAAITAPDVRNSQIIIFYDEKYYSSFWKRNNKYQKWTEIEKGSFAKERNITTSLPEKGYLEENFDEDFTYRTYIWFYGEWPKDI